MKANLKGLDFKQLAIAHGEKLGLGAVVLFSLLALGGMTRWATYQDKSPDELVAKVASERTAFDQSRWPEEQQQQFAQRHDISKGAQRMLAGVDITGLKYDVGHRIIHTLYKYQEPIREPEWLAPQLAIASLVRVPIQVQPTAEETEDATDPDSTKPGQEPEKTTPEDPRLVRRRATGGGGAGYGGTTGYGGDSAGGPGGGHGATPMGLSGQGIQLGGRGGDPRFSTDDPMDMEEYEYPEGYGDGEMMGMAANIEVEGVRFVAVRAVYPFRTQFQKIVDAMNDPDFASDPTKVVNILDFELQRQMAQPGADPWSGTPELVTPEKAKEVLSRAFDWDQEVVYPSITNPVITCPLPLRVMGMWDIEASHPSLKDFHLTEQGKEFQRLIQERLIQWQADQEQIRQQSQQLTKGGFSDIAHDTSGAYMRMGMGSMGAANYASTMNQMFGGQRGQQIDPNDRSLLEQQLKDAVTAAGHLLLFRFFDYTVVPGNAYRYRVRLKLENPNRLRAADEAVDPSVVAGQDRMTDWSEWTQPIYVEPDAEYYLARVKSSDEKAEVDIYQWLPDVGTMTKGLLAVGLGQFIGGETETTVVEPEVRVEREKVEFSTGDMLVDISDGTRRIDPGEHSALGIRTRQLELVDQAIVVNPAGELVALNPLKDLSERDEAEDWVASVRELYKDLEQAGKAALIPGMEGMEGMEGEDGDMYYQLMMQGMQMEGGASAESGGPGGGAGQRRGAGARGRNPSRKTSGGPPRR